MSEVKIIVDSIERILNNIDNIENDSFKNNFNKYVIIKSNLDSYRNRLNTIKKNLNENNLEESKNEINQILTDLLGNNEEQPTTNEFDPNDVSNLLENMPNDENTNEELQSEYDSDKTELLFDVSEIDNILNTSNFEDEEIKEEPLPKEDHIKEVEENSFNNFEELEKVDDNLFEIPTIETVDNIEQPMDINLDELNSMIETFD